VLHFRYRDFQRRGEKSYIKGAPRGGRAKRDQLHHWKKEFKGFWARQATGGTGGDACSFLLRFAGRVRLALLRRFGGVPAEEAMRLPSNLQQQLVLGSTFSQRVAVVLVGEARSGSTLAGATAFGMLPSFVYYYEPCRRSDDAHSQANTLRGAPCLAFTLRALACRLTYDEFELLLRDRRAMSQSAFGRELLRELRALNGFACSGLRLAPDDTRISGECRAAFRAAYFKWA
jgi:hypothetical protein